MTTVDGGSTWASQGTIISPIKAVPVDVYPNDSVKREASRSRARATSVR